MKRRHITENQLKAIVAESVKKVLNSCAPSAKVGRKLQEDWDLKPTFDDEETQARLKDDSNDMLANLPTERFLNYWNLRFKYKDPDMIDAIYNEYHKRHNRGEI